MHLGAMSILACAPSATLVTPTPAPAPVTTLAHTVTHPPMVAVCGVCGGAGASTLAYLLARFAAERARTGGPPVLILDAGGADGGLSRCAGAASPRSLAELADDIAAGRPLPSPLFAAASGGLRVIAGPSRPQPDPAPQAIARILADARSAHQMTVLDCGTLAAPTERLALQSASHIIWALPATGHGVDAAEQDRTSASLPEAIQMVVARRDPTADRASMGSLVRVATQREATLILMPHVDNLGPPSLETALEVCGVTLEALATKLRP